MTELEFIEVAIKASQLVDQPIANLHNIHLIVKVYDETIQYGYYSIERDVIEIISSLNLDWNTIAWLDVKDQMIAVRAALIPLLLETEEYHYGFEKFDVEFICKKFGFGFEGVCLP